MLEKLALKDLYAYKGFSVAVVAQKMHCSQSTVNYWLAKHKIKKRSISQAIYKKWNPHGDPFRKMPIDNIPKAVLFGVGVGLYWGEGTKSNPTSIRLGNSDPRLIRVFVSFLEHCFAIQRSKLRFGLQIFGDMDADKTIAFWKRELSVSRKQFLPSVVVTPHRGVGNYRVKTKTGVVTLYFHNKKLRDIIVSSIEKQAMAYKPK
ncbi:hypothetical protein EBR66_06950 [bacterium]|nr:hypothetical protein [bacterium]